MLSVIQTVHQFHLLHLQPEYKAEITDQNLSMTEDSGFFQPVFYLKIKFVKRIAKLSGTLLEIGMPALNPHGVHKLISCPNLRIRSA